MIYNNIASLPPGLVISHLCHRSLCCNIDHLSAEPQHINNTRQTCYSNGICFKHTFGDVSYPDCILKTKVCYKQQKIAVNSIHDIKTTGVYTNVYSIQLHKEMKEKYFIFFQLFWWSISVYTYM